MACWDFVKVDHVLQTRKLELIFGSKNMRIYQIVNMAVIVDHAVKGNNGIYQNLVHELGKC